MEFDTRLQYNASGTPVVPHPVVSAHNIQPEIEMCGICTFAWVNFLHESVPLEGKNLRLKFYFFSNNHGQSWSSRQLTRFTASVNSVDSWFRSVPVVLIRL